MQASKEMHSKMPCMHCGDVLWCDFVQHTLDVKSIGNSKIIWEDVQQSHHSVENTTGVAETYSIEFLKS